MKQRAIRLLKIYALVAGIGAIYAGILSVTDVGIPCMIRTVTGFRCPGCGISHMCMELIKGDMARAFSSNRAVFLLLPIFMLLWIRYMYRYIKEGTTKLQMLDNILLGVSIVVLVAWGIIRNLPFFLYLN